MKKKCLLTASFICCITYGALVSNAKTLVYPKVNSLDLELSDNSLLNKKNEFKGKVVDAKTGEPIIGANVRFLQTTLGGATNSNGYFSISMLPDKNTKIRVSAIGYESFTFVLSQALNKGNGEELIIELQEHPLNLNQVVITGTGTHHKMKETPVPIEVISNKEISNAGVSNFQQALSILNPSFSFTTNAMGTTNTINGLSNSHILVLVDGQKLAGNMSGSTDISRVNMSNVKRIEVLKGAASSLYGSDAIGGVINIITNESKTPVSASSYTKYGSNKQFEQSINADFYTQKFASYTAYTRRQSDGWQLNPEAVSIKNGIAGEPSRTVRMASDKFSSNIASQKFIFNPTKSLSIYANGSFYNKDIDRPSTIEDKSGYEYTLISRAYNFGLGAKYLLGKSNYISLDLYNDNYDNSNKYIVDVKDKKGNLINSIGDISLNQKQHYYSANAKTVINLGQYNILSGGLEYVNERLNNPGSLPEPKNNYTYSVYAQDEIKFLNNFKAIVGGRYVYHQKFGSKFTPKVSLMYSIDNFNVRASFAQGFRAPSLKELYYVKENRSSISLGNPNLKAENSNYYSLNFEYNCKFFAASASAYINDVKNLISLEDVADPSLIPNYDSKNKYLMYQNIASANVKGFDISLRSYLGYGFALSGGYSYVYAIDKDKDAPLAKSIRHSAIINANWNHSWGPYDLNVNLASTIKSKRYENAQEDAPGYSLWNLTIKNTFNKLGRFVLEPSIGIDNIFNYKDDRYYGYYYSTLSPGRSYYLSLLIKFR